MKRGGDFSLLTVGFSLLAAPFARATDLTDPLSVSNLVISQSRETRSVTVSYDLYNQGEPAFVRLDILTNDTSIGMENVKTVTGAVNFVVTPGTGKTITWNAKADWPGHLASDVKASLRAYYTNDMAQVPDIYMVVDLSDGSSATSYPISYTLTPPDPSNDVTCCSNRLWLKRVETNTFDMGLADEYAWHSVDNWHIANDALHSVTLTEAFFVGVFPVTRAQYTLVMGSVQSGQSGSSALCPVNLVSYDDIRGASLGSQWPTNKGVDASSFCGTLRARTGNRLFDLPTEAQWECACRAGTTTAWNDGSNFETNSAGRDASLDNLGWYNINGSSKSQPVGQKTPNAWGLYDCHGNVYEWCLDWTDSRTLGTHAATDPVGLSSGSNRIRRGGAYRSGVATCTSSWRAYCGPSQRNTDHGFRLVCRLGQ